MRFFVCIVFVSFALISPSPANGAILETTYFGANTYHLLESGSWADLEAEAQGVGGHLTSIQSQAENDFLQSAFSTNIFLIGFTDQNTEGLFEWASGEPVVYTNWFAGEPNDAGAGEDIALFNPNGFWNDIGDFDNRGVAKVSGVPEPSSSTLLGLGMLALVAFKVRRMRVAQNRA